VGREGKNLSVLVNLEDPLLAEALVVLPHPSENVSVNLLERLDPVLWIVRPPIRFPG